MGFGNMQQMMKRAQKMQQQMQKVQEELKDRTVEGSAGGGLVRVTASCSLDVRAVEIKPEAVDPDDVEFLAELVREATNDALQKAQELTQSEMAKVTGGLRLPGF